jgi:hypothetical protein
MSANAATKIDILRKMFIVVVMRSPDHSGPCVPVGGLSPRPRNSISQTAKRPSS